MVRAVPLLCVRSYTANATALDHDWTFWWCVLEGNFNAILAKPVECPWLFIAVVYSTQHLLNCTFLVFISVHKSIIWRRTYLVWVFLTLALWKNITSTSLANGRQQNKIARLPTQHDVTFCPFGCPSFALCYGEFDFCPSGWPFVLQHTAWVNVQECSMPRPRGSHALLGLVLL